MSPAMILLCLLVGPLTVTSYQSVKSQTDSSPTYTSIGQKTRKGGIAVSQDLLCPAGKKCKRNLKGCQTEMIHYGDYLYVKGLGIFQVNDCMGLTRWDRDLKKRVKIQRALDVWVPSYDEEKAFDRAHGTSKWVTYRVTFHDK